MLDYIRDKRFERFGKFRRSGSLSSKPSEHLNIRTIKLLITYLLLLFVCSVSGQENKTSVKLLARALPDSIMLRWAPSNFEGWNAGNKYGYNIVRFTLMRNGKMIIHPSSEPLNSEPIKPWPLNQWEKLADSDDYAGVAAQAIFGETFDLTTSKNTSLFDVVNKAKDQDTRFSFALFAADQSSNAARASGLWYTDTKAKKGEKYLYRVSLAIPNEVVAADTGFVFTSIDESLPLPKPLQLRAEFGDKGVILHWDRKTLNYIYNSYILERSNDGINYIKLKTQPIVYAVSADFPESNEMMYIDSLGENNKIYTYRLFGRTPFGETGPPSEIAKGKGIEELKYIPEISGNEELNGKITIKWKFPENQNVNIAGFKILRSSNYKTNFDTISGSIKPEARSFIDRTPRPTNYYEVVVIGKNGKKKKSLPALVQLSDTIPPDPPTGLKAVADTTGKLILTWNVNHEEDIFGYRIFRANASNEEYAQITPRPLKDTVFIDHINLKTLTKKIYYQIMAIDKRQNHSGFSMPLELERPDIVPPAPPALTQIKSTEKGVFLAWQNSSSSDVTKHLILRRATTESVAIIVKEISIVDTSNSYIDSTAMVNTVYYYAIAAQDKAGLRSVQTAEMAAQKMANDQLRVLENIKYKVDRKKFTITLTWKEPTDKVKNYIIYRKGGDTGVLVVYANIAGDRPEFIDMRVKADTNYTYCIKVISDNGTSGMVSKEIITSF